MKVQNPSNVCLSIGEIIQGWRFCYLEELQALIPGDAEFWRDIDKLWLKVPPDYIVLHPRDASHTSFRTKNPMPPGDFDDHNAQLFRSVHGAEADPLATIAKLVGL